MKKMKQIFLTLTLFAVVIMAKAQSNDKLFSGGKITYYGIDFTMAKFVGGPNDFPYATELKNRYFKEWNLLMYAEKEKYNLKKAFGKDEVAYDLAVTSAINETTDTNAMKQEFGPVTKITPAQINQVVANYTIATNTDGIGMVFIVESFDKTLAEGTSYVVFFDIASRYVLLAKPVTTAPRGFGIRNYWAATFYNALNLIKKTEWGKWKSTMQE